MTKRSPDLLALIALALLALIVGALSGQGANPIQVALSLPLLLFAPGYALTVVLLPKRTLGLAERLLLSLGLSLAVVVVAGVLLNVVVDSLGAWPWRIWLAGFTIILAAFGLWRREAGLQASIFSPQWHLSRRDAALLGAAVLLIVLAVGLGAFSGNPLAPGAPASAPFTEFWAVPARTGQQYIVDIGLRNYENERVAYHVTLEAGERVLAEWPQVILDSGSKWQVQTPLPQDFANRELVANAYRAGETEPYRHVRVVLSETED